MNEWEQIFTEEELIQVCPFCDNAILAWEKPIVFKAYGGAYFAHDDCAQDALSKKLITRDDIDGTDGGGE